MRLRLVRFSENNTKFHGFCRLATIAWPRSRPVEIVAKRAWWGMVEHCVVARHYTKLVCGAQAISEGFGLHFSNCCY